MYTKGIIFIRLMLVISRHGAFQNDLFVPEPLLYGQSDRSPLILLLDACCCLSYTDVGASKAAMA